MNRPSIAARATLAATNEDQRSTTNETTVDPIMKPRRPAWATAGAAADFFDGLGGTVCGFVSLCPALAAGAALAGAAAGDLAATSFAFLAPVWRSASARSRGSDIFSS